MRTCSRRRSIWWRALAVLCAAAALTFVPVARAVHAATLYRLFYALDIPPLLTGYELDESQNKHLIYTSLLRGTLGGLPIDSATLTLHPGASAGVGGGEFSLRTPAGPVKDGLILLTTDRAQTALVFLGTYLGARLQFKMVAPTATFGTGTISTKGLADTSFVADSEYVAAVTLGVAGLAPAPRAQAITGAESNLRLVSGYQQTTGTP